MQAWTCNIKFASGPSLWVHSGLTVAGGPTLPINESDGKERYGQFVEDLHRRLHAAGIDAIAFSGGEKSWLRILHLVGLVLSVLLVLVAIGVAVWRATGNRSRPCWSLEGPRGFSCG